MGWLRDSLKFKVSEPIVFVVLGVTKTGDWRDYKVLHSFSLSPFQLKNNSPILVDSIDAMNFDYVLVVREEVAKRNGWLK